MNTINLTLAALIAFSKDARAMVVQGGRRGTQGHSRPITREANLKFGGFGVLPRKNNFCGHTL